MIVAADSSPLLYLTLIGVSHQLPQLYETICIPRRAAEALGLRVIGTLGVIVDGHQRQVFDGHQALDALALTNFYASPELLRAIRNGLVS